MHNFQLSILIWHISRHYLKTTNKLGLRQKRVLAQWLSRYRRGSIKTMRAQGLWFEARPDRTLSPGSGQKMGSPWT